MLLPAATAVARYAIVETTREMFSSLYVALFSLLSLSLYI